MNKDSYCEHLNQIKACWECKRSQFLKCSHSDGEMFSSSHDYSRFLGIQYVCNRHWRRQDSKLEEASGDHVDIADEDGMVNSRLRVKMLMNRIDRSVAAMAGPKDVTENTVKVVCDKLDTSRFGVYSLKCQNGTPGVTSQNAIDRTRRVETILRNTSRYSHNSLGQWESGVKHAEKRIRATTLRMLMADHKLNSDRPTAQHSNTTCSKLLNNGHSSSR